MNRAGVFGGAFDPPHLAHLRVATRACDFLNLDQLLWIPTGVPPHKSITSRTELRHRIEMARIMAREDPRFELDLVEVNREGPSFMVDTLSDLSARFPNTEFYLIIGEDQLGAFGTWKNPDVILDLARLAYYGRSDTASAPANTECEAILLPGEPVDLSSTEIRTQIAEGNPLSESVLPAVLAYILSHGLYLES